MITSKEDLHTFVVADLSSHNISRWRFRYRLTRRIVFFQRLLRRAEYWTNVRKDPLGKLVARLLTFRLTVLGEKLGFTIPLNTCGPGLSLAHVGTVVVNPDAKIGANCRIHQGVTVGGVAAMAPIIGDDVWIGPGAVVSGPITVGRGSAIGANSVVNRDVPSDVTVAGAPARIIRRFGYRGASNSGAESGRPFSATATKP